MVLEDLTGRRFNYLTVICFAYKIVHGNNVEYIWKCRCDCGNEVLVSRRSLMRGRKSCGCKTKVSHVGSSYHAGVKSHGMSKTRFYKIYRKMIERCYYEQNNSYISNGIKVCDSWKENFLNFKNDMYESYLEHVEKYGEKDTSIDRIDVNSNYCKENCRWATIKEQANNKRNNVIIKYNNISKTLSEWADYLGWNYCTLANRHKRGWSVERMLTEKPKYQKIR